MWSELRRSSKQVKNKLTTKRVKRRESPKRAKKKSKRIRLMLRKVPRTKSPTSQQRRAAPRDQLLARKKT